MVICSISAVHFDIPTSNGHDIAGYLIFWRTIYLRSEAAFRVLTWLTGLIAPEMIVAWACMDYFNAFDDYMEMKKNGYSEWTLKHSFFTRMGGFQPVGNHPPLGHYADFIRAGLELDDGVCKKLYKDISDKSKADVLTKSLAVFQITRFLLETITRAANSLPISSLEYFTCAQVFCALLMYTFWFNKPHNIRETILLEVGKAQDENFGHGYVPIGSASPLAYSGLDL